MLSRVQVNANRLHYIKFGKCIMFYKVVISKTYFKPKHHCIWLDNLLE